MNQPIYRAIATRLQAIENCVKADSLGRTYVTRVIIYHSDRFDVVSYGNGLSYSVDDNINKISFFVQGDDASEFRAELEQWEKLFPETHYDEFYSEQIAIRHE